MSGRRPALAASGRDARASRRAAVPVRILNYGSLPAVLVGCVAVVGIVAAVNFQTSLTISGYLLPVSVAAWRGGIPAGVALSLLAAIGQLCADVYGERALSLDYALADVLTRLVTYVFVSALISALRRLLERQQQLANTDPLTGLANRRAFEEAARVEIDRAGRYSRPLSAAFIDVDHFKHINDTLGHAAGDDVLQAIGDELRSSLRSSDTAARIGGDEFVWLLPEGPPDAAKAALGSMRERLHKALSAGAVTATVSMGMVTFLRPPETVHSLLGSCDKLMYEAKQEGNSAVHVVLASDGSDTPAEGGKVLQAESPPRLLSRSAGPLVDDAAEVEAGERA